MAIESSTLQETGFLLQQKLQGLMPDFEISLKSELVHEINRLKRSRNAVILGHNYMEAALYHGVADIVGDSLQLARAAAQTSAEIIVFCGVRFMAETAKVLNPNKTVLLPARIGGCSLAAGITAEDLRTLRKKFPGVPIVSYINTYSAVHAECDSICTSSNAANILRSFNSEKIIFVPDEFLARNTAAEVGMQFIWANEIQENDPLPNGPLVIGWRARCEVHEQFKVSDVQAARQQYPDVVVLAHPECSPEVTAQADFVGSTSKLMDAVRKSAKKRFLILTECSMADNIIAENPDREMLRMCHVRCPHMAEVTLQEVKDALINMRNVIDVPAETRVRARKALDRMLEAS